MYRNAIAKWSKHGKQNIKLNYNFNSVGLTVNLPLKAESECHLLPFQDNLIEL